MNDDDKKIIQPNTNTDADEYQKILDEYAASVKPEEEEPVTADSDVNPELQDVDPIKLTAPDNIMITSNTDTSVPESKPEITVPTEEEKLPPIENPIKETESVQSETTKSPEEIKAKIDEILADDSNNNTTPPSSTTKSVSFKNIFIVSLLIFLVVAAGWFYFLFFYKSTSNSSLSSSVTPTSAVTPTETASSEVCELNGTTYQVGESFKSADGCNTCSCQTGNTIACTEMACDVTPVTTATKSATKTTVTPTKSATTNKTTITPTKITPTETLTDSYLGKTPFDPTKITVGSSVINMKVVGISTNSYNYTKVNLIPLNNIEGDGGLFIFDKNKKVVCEGLPCCDESSKGTDAIWQEEWCTGY